MYVLRGLLGAEGADGDGLVGAHELYEPKDGVGVLVVPLGAYPLGQAGALALHVIGQEQPAAGVRREQQLAEQLRRLVEQAVVPGQEAILGEGCVKAGGLYLAYAADNGLHAQAVQPVHIGGKAVEVRAADGAAPQHVGDERVHGRRLGVELREQAQAQRRGFELVGAQGGQEHARQDLLAPKLHPAPLLSCESPDIIAHNAALAIQFIPKEVNYL